MEVDSCAAWESANEVVEDCLYFNDTATQERILHEKPWNSDGRYFKKVRISALALMKMAIHARSGGRLEIMGLMQGKIRGEEFVIMDSFALPVEGTETRVNAGGEAMAYMVNYREAGETVGRSENVVGWYHSHPGYGCWLSGIDVQTQLLYQQHQEPFLAVVVDPTRTCASGRVDIGAFRCFPVSYVPSEATDDEFEVVPLSKVEDFGIHWKQYYKLPIEVFKSPADTVLLERLWTSQWSDALSSCPFVMNAEYHDSCVQDLARKVRGLGDHSFKGKKGSVNPSKKNIERRVRDASNQSVQFSSKQIQALATEAVKLALF